MNKKIIHTVFEAVAERLPGAVAVADSKGAHSYALLNETANGIAEFLLQKGLQAGDICGVWMNPGFGQVAAMLGIFKAGGIFLPLDSAFPLRRRQQIFSHTRPRILLTDTDNHAEYRDCAPLLETLPERVAMLEGTQLREELGEEGFGRPYEPVKSNPALRSGEEDGIYIFYTSGSTGDAKAILGRQKSLSQFIHWEMKEFDAQEGLRVSQLAQITFDASLRDIWLPLISGGTVCVPPADARRDMAALLRWLQDSRVNLVHCVPSLFRALLREIRALQAQGEDCSLPHLRHILMAGEPLFARDVQEWRRLMGTGTELVNLYGATESTMVRTFHRIGEVPADPARPLHVGRAIGNTAVAVIKGNRLAEAGEIGEIYIRTPFLSLGYYGNEALTRTVFVPNPLEPAAAERLYKTGDLGRFLPDGNLEVLGRLDQMVKVNGVRIELGEIESLLRGIPGMGESVVLARPNRLGEQRLVCYYVSEADLSPSLIREGLSHALPAYMLPAYYVKLPELPLNLNGKVDRKALPAPEEMLYEHLTYVPPEGEAEEAIAGIMAGVLGLQKLSATAGFFEVGGHSLLATTVVSRFYKELGFEISLADFFLNATVRQLAHRYAQSDPKAAFAGIPRIEDAADYAVSPAQRRLYLYDQRHGSSRDYHIHLLYDHPGEIEPEAAKKAWNAVILRHEVLRTTFTESAGEVRQIVHKAPLSGLEIQAIADPEAQTRAFFALPLSLQNGPLMRGCILQGAQDCRLLVNLHHIVGDGYSTGVLQGEWQEAYEAFRAGREWTPESLPVQYKDYSAWSWTQIEGEAAETMRTFWHAAFSGELPRPELTLPLRTGGPEGAAAYHCHLDGDTLNGLRRLGAEMKGSLYMVLLSAWQLSLARFTGLDRIVTGSPVAGRQHEDLQKLAGFFVNALMLNSRMEAGKPYRDFFVTLRDQVLHALEYQAYPFEDLCEELNLDMSEGHYPVSGIFLNFLNFEGAQLQEIHAGEAHHEVLSEPLKFDINCYVYEYADGMHLQVDYKTHRYAPELIEALTGTFRSILKEISINPDQAIDDLGISETVSKGSEQPDAPWYAGSRSLIQVFAETVATHPERPAVISEAGNYSYRELYSRAASLALHIREQAPDSARIAFSVAHGPLTAVCVWGILLAGKSYVALPPDIPEARLTGMLSRSGAELCLTDAERPEITLPVCDVRQIGPLEGEFELPDTGPDTESYLLFTSGSTGEPKGVRQTHAAMLHFMSQYSAAAAITEADRHSGISGAAFDAFNNDFYGAMLNGAAWCPYEPLKAAHPAEWAEWIRSNAITVWQSTPSLFRRLETGDEGLPDTLRLVKMAGEPVLRQDFLRFRSLAASHAGFMVSYGATESTFTAVRTYFMQDMPDSSILSPGKPVARTQVRVCDDKGRSLGVYEEGEVWIGSDFLTPGYLDAELDALSFTTQNGQRFYRSGDRGRILPDGSLRMSRRREGMLKLHGVRIEPREVENALMRIPGMRQAAVSLSPSGDQLAAWIVCDRDLTLREVHQFLSGKLNPAMIPSLVGRCRDLPLNRNGKTDYRNLPDMEGIALPSGVEYIEPHTDTERRLADIWKEILNKNEIGREDHFFLLGGHSLRAVRLSAAIRERMGKELAIRDAFRLPVLKEQALHLDGAGKSADGSLQKAPDAEYYPLSHSQLRMWLISRADARAGAAHNISQVYRLPELHAGHFRSALSKLILRHEALRTRFLPMEPEPVQRIDPEPNTPYLFEYDLRTAVDAESEWDRISSEAALTEFDLEQGPLFRVDLARIRGNEWTIALTVHHIVSDGWSMQVLLRDLQELYEAQMATRPPVLPELAYRYVDYAWSQRRALQEGQCESQRDYWLKKLSAPHAAPEWPLDKPRPLRRSYRGARHEFRIPDALRERMEESAREQGMSSFSLQMAAIKTLLYRYTGESDLIVGTGTAGRTDSALEAVAGFFIQSLAIRDHITDEMGFGALSAAVSRSLIEAMENEAYPLDKLMEEIGIERIPGRNPLYDVMAVQQNADLLGAGTIERVEASGIRSGISGSGMAKFDLTFVFSGEGSPWCSIEYNTDIFSETRIRRMESHFLTLLQVGLEAPDQPLRTLEMRVEDEQVEWDRRLTERAEFRITEDIGSLFDAIADRRPEATALVFGEQKLKYGELKEKASRIAAGLAKAYPTGARIALLFNRGTDMITAILGVLKAGMTYVPLSPDLPAARMALLCEEADCRAILHDETNARHLPQGITSLQLEESLRDSWTEVMKDSRGNPEAPAYVMFTSGSTGNPKGVQIPQRAVIHLALHAHFIRLNPEDRILQLSHYAFDGSVFDIFYSLLNGCELHIPDDEEARSVHRVADMLHAQRIDHVFMTTALFNQIADLQPEAFSGLKSLLFGGERVHTAAVEKALQYTAEGVLHHMYGPTETTVFATSHPVKAGEDYSLTVPIGTALKGKEILILDALGQPVPDGLPGEICIGGEGLALGYIGHEALNQAKFVPHPFREGEKLYRSGDIGRINYTGALEFIDRMDTQVKMRGFRIEPGEIEALLSASEGVKQTHVRPLYTDGRVDALAAYFTGDADPAALREALGKSLPAYMIPAFFVPLDELPLNRNGKIGGKRLPDPRKREVADNGVRNPLELKLAALWCEVLNVTAVSATDDFFRLGGHSLAAARLSAAVQRSMECHLDLLDIFAHPVLSDMAGYLRQADAETVIPAVKRVEDRPHYPLSATQLNLYFLHLLDPGSDVYSIGGTYEWDQAPETESLRKALLQIMQRHEVLRTVFLEVEGRPVQVIREEMELPFTLTDLRDAENWQSMADSCCRKTARGGFDIQNGPLWRVQLILLPDERALLAMGVHHIISDGLSLSLLALEVEQEIQGHAAPEPMPFRYVDFAIWQQELDSHPAGKRMRAFFKQMLRLPLPTLTLPYDFPRPASRSFAGDMYHSSWPAEKWDVLRKGPLRQFGGDFSLLMALYAVWIYRQSGQEEMIIGSPVAGRLGAGFEGQIGCYVNTLPLRLQVKPEMRLSEWVQEVNQLSRQALRNQMYPVDRFESELSRERDRSRAPFFDTGFSWQDKELASTGESDFAPARTTSKYDLWLFVESYEGGLNFSWEYNTQLFLPETVAGFAATFEALLEAAIAYPEAKTGQLEMGEEVNTTKKEEAAGFEFEFD